jgi:hypothetical protein
MMLLARSSYVAFSVVSHTRVGSVLMGSRNYQSPAYRRVKKKKKNTGAIGTSTTLEMAMAAPHDFSQLDNRALLTLAALENHSARIEVLKRHIMVSDNVSYEEATKTFDVIQATNRRWMPLTSLPYLVGITTATTAGFASIPLCFHSPTVHSFNEVFVTTDVPEPADLETMLELGSWAWNWMEPPLGTLSFMLLCLQFSRAQLQNLGIRPFTQYIKAQRAHRLCREFPGYDDRVLSDFSTTDSILG